MHRPRVQECEAAPFFWPCSGSLARNGYVTHYFNILSARKSSSYMLHGVNEASIMGVWGRIVPKHRRTMLGKAMHT